jgi:pantetheine-phosphate adenylyltransferase
MSHPVIAVYPGTFDPITLGHQDLIQRCAGLFHTLIVAVAVAHHKKTLFSLEERVDMVRESLQHCPNVQVQGFTGLMRDFALAQGAHVMLRGVRSITDFDYEAQLAGMNKVLAPQVETLFLTPDARYQHISSTMVREVAMLHGDVSQLVAPGVQARLRVKAGA